MRNFEYNCNKASVVCTDIYRKMFVYRKPCMIKCQQLKRS